MLVEDIVMKWGRRTTCTCYLHQFIYLKSDFVCQMVTSVATFLFVYNTLNVYYKKTIYILIMI